MTDISRETVPKVPDDLQVFDLTKKKKKKKDKEHTTENVSNVDAVPKVPDDLEMFALSKKKKKSDKASRVSKPEEDSQKTQENKEMEDEDEDEDEIGEAELKEEVPEVDEALDAIKSNPSAWLSSDREYTYIEMLDRLLVTLRENNPDLIERRRHVMRPPQVMRMGTKRTVFANFSEICGLMKRNPEHVYLYYMAELGTEASIDGNNRLILKGKFQVKTIEGVLRKYIAAYVTCNMCRSPNTEMEKDQVSRLHFLKCKNCGSSRSVPPINKGFHATTKADRRAAKR